MMTKQNDAVALTDEPLDAVTGGAAFIGIPPEPEIGGGNKYHDKGSYVSISPVPTPIPKVLFPRGRARVIWPQY